MKPRYAWAVLACGAFVLDAGGAAAQDVKARTLKFAHQNTKEHPQGLGVAKFAELVAAKSGGKIKVDQFAGGTLGGDLATVSALQSGSIDMTVLNTGLLAGVVKEAVLVDLPFLFNSAQEADAVMDGPFGKKLNDLTCSRRISSGSRTGISGSATSRTASAPINKMEDIAGLKLRVLQSPVVIDTFTALGAVPTPVPFPEVYKALEKKVVDGQENPVTVIADSKFEAVQKYLAITHHIYNPQSVLISKTDVGRDGRRREEDRPGRRHRSNRLPAQGVARAIERGARRAQEGAE